MENEAQLKQANRIVGYLERHGALTIRELRVKGVRIDLGQLRELLAQLVAIGYVAAQAAPSGATTTTRKKSPGRGSSRLLR
jgi:hypothetical protein